MIDLDTLSKWENGREAVTYEDVMALIAEVRELREVVGQLQKTIEGAITRMERTGVAEAYPLLLMARAVGR